jgi:hypothetical protein
MLDSSEIVAICRELFEAGFEVVDDLLGQNIGIREVAPAISFLKTTGHVL